MIKIILSITVLMLHPLLSMGANVTIDTSTILVIDESSSTLTYNSPSMYWDESEELITAKFGGLVEVFQTDYYIDTRYDGTPTYSPSTLRRISINFTTLELPPEVSDFNPVYDIGPFRMYGVEIPGYEWSFCAIEIAMGNMCSETIFRMGEPEDLTGTFDGTDLIVDGHLGHGRSDSYYSFHIEASSVPLPGGIILFASGVIAAFGLLRLKRTNISTST